MKSEYDRVSKRDRLGLTPDLTTRDLWRSRRWTERKVCCGFLSPLKIHRLELATYGSSGQHTNHYITKATIWGSRWLEISWAVEAPSLLNRHSAPSSWPYRGVSNGCLMYLDQPVRKRLPITKRLNRLMQFPPGSYFFLFLRSKYSPQWPVLKCPRSILYNTNWHAKII
jgi:hypothetical protein